MCPSVCEPVVFVLFFFLSPLPILRCPAFFFSLLPGGWRVVLYCRWPEQTKLQKKPKAEWKAAAAVSDQYNTIQVMIFITSRTLWGVLCLFLFFFLLD